MDARERQSNFLSGVASEGLPMFQEIVLLPCTYRQLINELKRSKTKHEFQKVES